ncbi:hypothetical protein G7Y89_g3787 [Cudoniella acicularis]|uniref:Peroxidase n=1 Tax=Cudoniella acicularis TaxID=354080 RepID=A0A8H4RS19_9HELO|nr:hypothetical protein G7Y89_g3787 [Cudoniella acicularis]
MSFSKLIAPYFALSAIPAASAAFFYPNVQTSLVEGIFVDAHGAHATGFVDAVTPCTRYVSGAATVGRETAAQWVRVSFHDFVTHHTSDGSGGLDASIGFEADRAENAGAAMNDTIRFFRNRVNAKIGSADFLALSVSVAVQNCGGPIIPVRAGRIDATGPGPFGVPAPTTTLNDTLSMFGGAGMSQSDAITLVACGHTFGAVHHGVFPDVVGPDAITPNNTAGGVNFDDSPAVFDDHNVHAYIDGTGAKGGTLVTTPNVTSQSDLRLFSSDNNATLLALYNEQGSFVNTCATLFQRMIETVPSNVVLSDVITPQTLKPVNSTLDFDTNGNLIFTGSIRVLSNESAVAPESLTHTTSLNSTALNITPEDEGGYSIYGNTTFYPFNQPISKPSAFTSFSVIGSGISSETFAVQAQTFVVPSASSNSESEDGTVTVSFTVAVLNSSTAPIVKVSIPVVQPNTFGPLVEIFNNVAVTAAGTKAGYSLFTGSVSAGVWTHGTTEVAIVNGSGNELDVLMVV